MNLHKIGSTAGPIIVFALTSQRARDTMGFPSYEIDQRNGAQRTMRRCYHNCVTTSERAHFWVDTSGEPRNTYARTCPQCEDYNCPVRP